YQAAQVQVEELEKLNRLKDDFLNTISHELRTPMSSIKMSIQLLEILLNRILPHPLNTPNSSDLESHSPNTTHPIGTPGSTSSTSSTNCTSSTASTALYPKLEQCVRILQEECDREIAIINDLLMLQQLEAGTHLLANNSIPVPDWIPQVLESFQDKIAKQHQTLHLKLAKNLPSITSDLSMLNRVLVELLNNACKFTPSGGTITLLAYPIAASPHCIGAAVRLQVINTGVEIPFDQIPLIFNQFYRIPSNDPWKYGGTGLGLTLVKKMVNCLGGEIWANSQAGQTSLTIDLPINPPKE
ncbi:MAG TPA: HAMP domain-containing sensor histidine kinase, partial [Allocoleopsis sp.]